MLFFTCFLRFVCIPRHPLVTCFCVFCAFFSGLVLHYFCIVYAFFMFCCVIRTSFSVHHNDRICRNQFERQKELRKLQAGKSSLPANKRADGLITESTPLCLQAVQRKLHPDSKREARPVPAFPMPVAARISKMVQTAETMMSDTTIIQCGLYTRNYMLACFLHLVAG